MKIGINIIKELIEQSEKSFKIVRERIIDSVEKVKKICLDILEKFCLKRNDIIYIFVLFFINLVFHFVPLICIEKHRVNRN